MSGIEIDQTLGGELLRYAEAILRCHVAGEESRYTDTPPPTIAAILQAEFGAFCTLKRNGTLRGCIGNFAGSGQLGTVLPRVVRDSALRDTRFPPVSPTELPEIALSLSILFPAYPIADPTEIVLGRDGTILTLGRHRAVFLPEVAVEQGWDTERMLSQLSRKAGLDPERWRSSEAKFEVFQTVHIAWASAPVPGADRQVVIEGGGYAR